MSARQRIAALRASLHDVASDLDGEAIRQGGRTRQEIHRAAASTRSAVGALSDALSLRLVE